MIKVHYTEAALQSILKPGKNTLFDEADRLLEEDEKEMHSLIQRLHKNNEKITINSLYQNFTGGQYGWYDMAIACVCAKLYMRGTVSIYEGVVQLDRNEVYSALSRRRDLERYVIKLAAVIKDAQVSALKEFYREYFYEDLKVSSAKEAGIGFKTKLNSQLEMLEGHIRNINLYPFISSIEPSVARIRKYRDKDWDYFFEHIDELEDELLQDRVEVLDKFLKFMGTDGNGEQLQLWKDLKNYYDTHRHNFSELKQDDLVERLRMGIESEAPYKNNLLRHSEQARKALQSMEEGYLKNLRQEAAKKLDSHISSVKSIPEFAELSTEQQAQVLDPLKVILEHDIKTSTQFSQVRDRSGQFARARVEEARDIILELAKKVDIRYASSTEKAFRFRKSELADEADVLEYIELLRKHYLKLVKENKRIGL